MLAIRLVAEPDRLDVARPARPLRRLDGGRCTSAEPVSTAVAARTALADEAAALLPAARLTGAAGEIHALLRPGRTPAGCCCSASATATRPAGGRPARRWPARLADETHITVALPADVTPAAVARPRRGAAGSPRTGSG